MPDDKKIDVTRIPVPVLTSANQIPLEPDYGKDLGQIEIDWYRNNLIEAQSMFKERRRYALWLFWLSVIWLIVILAFLLFAAIKTMFGIDFELSDAVLIALITTTTINVLGLFYIVARWLFPSKLINQLHATNLPPESPNPNGGNDT
jgi:hypothetical protein